MAQAQISALQLRQLQRRRDAETDVAAAAMSWLEGGLETSSMYTSIRQVNTAYFLHTSHQSTPCGR